MICPEPPVEPLAPVAIRKVALLPSYRYSWVRQEPCWLSVLPLMPVGFSHASLTRLLQNKTQPWWCLELHAAMLLKQRPKTLRPLLAAAGNPGAGPRKSWLGLVPTVGLGVVFRMATAAELDAVVAQGLFPKELSIAGERLVRLERLKHAL